MQIKNMHINEKNPNSRGAILMAVIESSFQ